MSPARTAVLWDVLVSDVGQVVLAINVVPDPVIRDFNILEWCLKHSLNWGGVLFPASLIWCDLGRY